MTAPSIVALTPPSRFPTVVFDPGEWWSALAAQEFHLSRLSLNAEWWRAVCHPEIASVIQPGGLRQFLPGVGCAELAASGRGAAAGLDELCRPGAYRSVPAYVQAVTPVADHLFRLNRAQSELYFSLENGVRVRKLNYHDSGSLVAYARRKTTLSALISRALPDPLPAIGLLVVNVTSPEDLLCAAIAVMCLRERQPRMQVCLADHGFENFTLAPHLERLRLAGTLDSIFDCVVESKEERDAVVPAVARAIAAGHSPRGFLRLKDVEPWTAAPPHAYVPPPPTATFAAEPIFWTRLSGRRCYWSKCAFCVHNVKYVSPAAPSVREIPAAVDRLKALRKGGYRSFIFSDEAVSPAMLDRLSQELLASGLALRWICRSKLECAFDRPLFERMRDAGCAEVLFGLESISAQTLRSMDKYTSGLDAPAIRRIVAEMGAAGIGVHLNLMAGFPGETPEDLTRSVDFAIDALREVPSATFALNYFTAFPGTPVTAEPAAFGIRLLPAPGDMPSALSFRPILAQRRNARRVARLYPKLQARLESALGWDRFGRNNGTRAALGLYFLSGHSVTFKTEGQNPFRFPPAHNIHKGGAAWPFAACS